MEKITDYFGCRVFGDDAMKNRLPKEVYKTLKKTIKEGNDLDLNIANAVAHAMKEWALELGATHFTHWFQPMTGITAEKHDSFISPTKDGKILLSFAGKELIKGEPDASSFPSGGLRATFEARGYTAWDPTSYAFVKDKTLCIPTVFCSYSGEVLDKKTPLLRSMEAINTQAKRLLQLFGHNDIKQVITTVGPEQEYFIIDKNLYKKRKDLIYTGRTLVGARPPKGQELDDHYFGSLRPRISKFMQDLDRELWEYGVFAKTKHNEVSPAQHELAPVFTTSNVAADQNQLTMEVIKKVAERHDLICLLHEKPFKGVNGSGKHNNWSISTDKGINLLEPGTSPKDNVQFLLILVAIIKAIDEYQDLLRLSAASPGNDHRLGANEAPPAIISMFLGTELTNVLEELATGKVKLQDIDEYMKLGVHVLPNFPKDSTDRNRTSPFAFTGNKFEFRMLGSAFSISGPNFTMNTIIAKQFKEFADQLENAKDFNEELKTLIKETYIKHKRIVFNGNNYSPDWVDEAKERGLLNLRTSVEAYQVLSAPKNVELFEEFSVLSKPELESRVEILYDNHAKTLNIEAITFVDMIKKQIIPACNKYLFDTAKGINDIKAVAAYLNLEAQNSLLDNLSTLINDLTVKTSELEDLIAGAGAYSSAKELAIYLSDVVMIKCNEARDVADKLELIVGSDYWPIPTYGDLLYSV